LGFAKLRSGDQYEIILRLGSQKWRMRGTIKSFNDQVWDNNTATMQPLLSDIINVKVSPGPKLRGARRGRSPPSSNPPRVL